MILPGSRTLFAALAVCLIAAATPALAADASYCVTCKNPNQTYLCRISGGGAKPSDALKLYCVIRTAKEGGHGSCSAVRSTSCNGIEKVYAYDGPMPDDITSGVRKARERIERENKAFEKSNTDGPDTLVELTGRARDRWRNARGALTGPEEQANQPLPQEQAQTPPVSADASPPAYPEATEADAGERPGLARRSYRCVVSLFRNCREGASEGQ